MSKPTGVPVSTRLWPEDVAKIDEVVDWMKASFPGSRPSRSDAMRFLIQSSGTLLQGMHTTISYPPGAVMQLPGQRDDDAA